MALSFVLLIGAGLMLRSFVALGRVHPGFDPNHVLTFNLPSQLPQPAQRAAFKQQLRERLQAIPGVQSAAAAVPLPLDGALFNGRWGTETALADPTKFRQANIHIITPGYFETLRTRLIAGRTFTDADINVNQQTNQPKQLVIDDMLAARAFPNDTAVGKRLLARITTPEPEWFEVIGVVAHQRHSSLAVDGPEAMFLADGYLGHGAASRWAVPTSGDPNQIVAAVRGGAADRSARAARRGAADDRVRRQGDGADPLHHDADRHLSSPCCSPASLRRARDDRAAADRRDRHAHGSARRAAASSA